jgi:hypothetical protein
MCLVFLENPIFRLLGLVILVWGWFFGFIVVFTLPFLISLFPI